MPAERMTDDEIICTWMEKKPEPDRHFCSGISPLKWWSWEDEHSRGGRAIFYPRKLNLDALHEVEKRLTDEQRRIYIGALMGWHNPYFAANPHCGDIHIGMVVALVHATTAQKIRALAAILRLLVGVQNA